MLAEFLTEARQRVDTALGQLLPAASIHPAQLHEAMRYSVFNGGKRVRPALVYATGRALNNDSERLDIAASAVELIHAYSLVHDDLPAMDDDDLRRGKPTCHKAFDEATAILAGDALQTLAFHIIAHNHSIDEDGSRRIGMIESLALASGSRGMAGGQAIDLAAVGETMDIAQLEDMHIHKTGALIRASVKLGALCSDQITSNQLERLDHYAKCIGLAFQIRDDILDIEGDTETIGKTQGADIALNKPTYPALLGLDGAKERAVDLRNDALQALEPFGEGADLLRELAKYIVDRVS
ncbi:geranyl transferase [Solemya pervernicosa gill symbiont]|uniref:Geranyl transferase n=2 Tax=Gammaproteobacteria incertae sedis TaxID=118884 RepID=A0A1T2L188_9GAMM|nr:farnesyl diphosphate synthase [Candidatus Reidiella endopervernicosa]OOZ38832.1 geranyl transferase [Solemya pervernicosa gill symbiont]QKQ27421.1 (2E,6E)-farnesyl diphosphate synthase [Candidatus Reidiella endopervernicosa]